MPTLYLCCSAVAFAPPVMGLCLAVIHDNGVGHICPCAKPGLPHQASSWQNTYTIRPQLGRTYGDHASESMTGERCVGLSWQPQMHVQQPFLAVATQSCVSLWCFERCAQSMCQNHAPSCLELGEFLFLLSARELWRESACQSIVCKYGWRQFRHALTSLGSNLWYAGASWTGCVCAQT